MNGFNLIFFYEKKKIALKKEYVNIRLTICEEIKLNLDKHRAVAFSLTPMQKKKKNSKTLFPDFQNC